MQTDDYYQMKILSWNYEIISFRLEYLKPYNYAQIIYIWYIFRKLDI